MNDAGKRLIFADTMTFLESLDGPLRHGPATIFYNEAGCCG